MQNTESCRGRKQFLGRKSSTFNTYKWLTIIFTKQGFNEGIPLQPIPFQTLPSFDAILQRLKTEFPDGQDDFFG